MQIFQNKYHREKESVTLTQSSMNYTECGSCSYKLQY